MITARALVHGRRAALPRALLASRPLTSDGYLHKTAIPTDKFQDSLPRLPVPKLEDSMKRFLYSAEPLLSAEDLAATKAEVEAFQAGAGPALQGQLEAKAKEGYTSFISGWWFDMYLENRQPLMLNVNPQLTFQMDPTPAKNDQAERAASLMVSSARFIRTLADGHLEPDLFHTAPEKSKTGTANLGGGESSSVGVLSSMRLSTGSSMAVSIGLSRGGCLWGSIA